ncbi:hypothetical protein [Amycolatopsis sp. cmx-4-68]|uniref:hypothetical protein n=1 Tax=Amycolatopsis sp. cmx-4-68 TaxID=2790938 RepID=UPI00397DA100
MPENNQSGFSADLDRMEQGIREYLDPAVAHFQQVSAAVGSIKDYDPKKLFGFSLGTLLPSMMYEIVRDAVVDREQVAAEWLTAFRDTLVEIVRTYRTADEASAENLRRAGQLP